MGRKLLRVTFGVSVWASLLVSVPGVRKPRRRVRGGACAQVVAGMFILSLLPLRISIIR